MTFGGSGRIAMTLTPYAIHSRRGRTVDKMATEVDPDTLRSYTMEALKKLCPERHIAVYGKRKEELNAALSETPTREFSAEQKVDELPTGSGPLELVGLVMQMQWEQMHWMAEQQRRQEE